MIAQIKSNIMRIRYGVYVEPISGGETSSGDDGCRPQVLLSSMIDALGAVFHMFTSALLELRQNERRSSCGEDVIQASEEAKTLLSRARDELISEANVSSCGGHIGPTTTPEAILIRVIERLVAGVCEDGNLNIMSMFQMCLEKLVSSAFWTRSTPQLTFSL